MPSPTDRYYTETHEWFKPEGDGVTVGITQFAVDQLADVTYLEFPAPGKALKANESFGEIESVKATNELYSPVDGSVALINEDVKKDPSLVNMDPYGKGWLIKIKTAAKDFSAFLSAQQYDAKNPQG